jgi:hypothetical protein
VKAWGKHRADLDGKFQKLSGYVIKFLVSHLRNLKKYQELVKDVQILLRLA